MCTLHFACAFLHSWTWTALWLMLLWTQVRGLSFGPSFRHFWVGTKGGISGSYGNSVFLFWEILYWGCTILHWCWWCARVSIIPRQHLSSVSVLFASSHSRGCDVVCHCTFDLHFLMISDAEHLVMCLLATYIFSLEQPFIWKVYYPQSTGWWSIWCHRY